MFYPTCYTDIVLSLKDAMAECLREAEEAERREKADKLAAILDNPDLTEEEKMKVLAWCCHEIFPYLLSIYLSRYYLSIYLSIYLSVCLFNYIHIHISFSLLRLHMSKAILGSMSLEEQAKIQQLLKDGMTMEEIVKQYKGTAYFLKYIKSVQYVRLTST